MKNMSSGTCQIIIAGLSVVIACLQLRLSKQINRQNISKEKGYFIELHYIGVEDVDIAKERVAARVRRGGHGISEKDIERRYIESFNNLKIVLPECDLAAFYDNTIEFRRFAIYKNGKHVRVSHKMPMWYEKFH